MTSNPEYLTDLLDAPQIIKPLISQPDGNYIQNRDILTELEAEEKRLIMAYGISSFLTTASLLLPIYPFGAIAGATVTGLSMEYFTRVRRIYLVTKMLLEAFEKDGIVITLRVQTNIALIDLFVKMPDKRSFALLLRNHDNGKAKWRADKKLFYIYKVGKKPRRWDSLTKTIEQLQSTIYLKNLKSPLLGKASAERNRPINKVVVLCGNTKIHLDNTAELWVEFGQTKALKICEDVVTYVVEQENLINFLLPPTK